MHCGDGARALEPAGPPRLQRRYRFPLVRLFARERPRRPNAEAIVSATGGIAAAGCNAKVRGVANPEPPTVNPKTAVSGRPCRAIAGRSLVRIVEAIFEPLPCIAGHVVKAERICFKRTDGRRTDVIPFGATHTAIGVSLAELIAPVIGCRGPGAGHVFP